LKTTKNSCFENYTTYSKFTIASGARAGNFTGSEKSNWKRTLNSEFVKQALAKVGNPNILVNLVSRRVRQLTTGGSEGRPLLADTTGMGAGDIALLEIIEDKMDYQLLEAPGETEPAPKKKKKS